MVKHFPFQDIFKINQSGALILVKNPKVKGQLRLRDGGSNIMLVIHLLLLRPVKRSGTERALSAFPP